MLIEGEDISPQINPLQCEDSNVILLSLLFLLLKILLILRRFLFDTDIGEIIRNDPAIERIDADGFPKSVWIDDGSEFLHVKLTDMAAPEHVSSSDDVSMNLSSLVRDRGICVD